MSVPLYSNSLLRLATEVADYPPLASPDAVAEHRAKPCGSRIAVSLALDDAGRVTGCGLSVHACALGQASAALLARSIKGRTAAEIVVTRDRLTAYLEGGAADAGDWPDLGMLEAARGYPARHPAIRLPFEAASEAVCRARAKA